MNDADKMWEDYQQRIKHLTEERDLLNKQIDKCEQRLAWISSRCDEADSFGDEIDTDDVRRWLTEVV